MAMDLDGRTNEFVGQFSLYGADAAKADGILAFRDGYKKAVADAAAVARDWGKPGPGGIDITGGIPSEIYIGIGRGRYEDDRGDYELAGEIVEAARDEIAAAIESLLTPKSE